jgi:hypothetical protein
MAALHDIGSTIRVRVTPHTPETPSSWKSLTLQIGTAGRDYTLAVMAHGSDVRAVWNVEELGRWLTIALDDPVTASAVDGIVARGCS